MTQKSLSALALPLVLSFTVRFLFTLVDMAYAAQIKDEVPYGVAAITMFLPIQGVFIALWAGLSAGFTANLSQAFGSRDEQRVQQLKRAMIRLLARLVPLMAGLGGVIYLWISQEQNLAPELRRDALTYALILVWSSPFTSFISIYPDSIVKAHHATKATAMAGIVSSLANFCLNTLFVFGFGWGIAGIALATALSRWAGFAYAMHKVRRLEAERLADPSWDQGPGTWSTGPLRDILVLAIPGSLTFLLVAGQNFMINKILAAQSAPEALLSAYGIYDRLVNLVLMPVIATGVAVLPFVARLLPEGQRAKVRQDLFRSSLHASGLVLLLGIPSCWLLAEPISRFFLPEDAPPQAMELAPIYLSLVPLIALLTLPFLMLRPVFEAARQPRLGVRMTIQKVLLLEAPLLLAGYALARNFAFDPFLGILLGLGCGGLLASLLTWSAARRLLADPDPQNPADPGSD